MTHDCQKEENCTADVEVVIDTTSALAVQYGENKYSCCNYDFCNDNALRVPAAPPPNPNSLKRPQCNSANSWIHRPYEVHSNASMNVDPRLMELRLDLGAETSKWTLHTAPPQSKSWLFSQDTSTPDCFTIAGVIQKGFCGIRYKVDPVRHNSLACFSCGFCEAEMFSGVLQQDWGQNLQYRPDRLWWKFVSPFVLTIDTGKRRAP